MRQEKLPYIDMRQELDFEPGDSPCSIFLSLFDLPNELTYHLLWTFWYLDALHEEGNLDPEIGSYLSHKASACPLGIESAKVTIKGILVRLAKDF